MTKTTKNKILKALGAVAVIAFGGAMVPSASQLISTIRAKVPFLNS